MVATNRCQPPTRVTLRALRPGYWQIHIPPHDQSAYIVEDTLEVRKATTYQPISHDGPSQG